METRRSLESIKKEDGDNWKKHNCGCLCGCNTNVLRFLECDHIDPKDKIDSICNMVKNNKYSLQDVINELKKCRGIYSKKEDWASYVTTDGLLVTGQNPASSNEAAKQLLSLLQNKSV